METELRRRLTIADVMILVVTAAIVLVDLGIPRFPWGTPWDRYGARLTWGGLAGTICLVVIRLCKPRPDRESLWRQPGWIASVAVIGSLPVEYFRQLTFLTRTLISTPVLSWFEILLTTLIEMAFQVPDDALMVVVLSWTILRLSGRWKAEASWIDRAGRLVGLYWISLGIANGTSRFFL